ncbi:oxysterol-binding protein [Zalerion maritima]|uniref:Oxysterol-binding protein n=1 Tax=Zalerion maritima TaxID=339359 RepID=A0AAD5RN41_9PEZI|nr:oxysterol-binding protein [Zalerion maritima]
MAGIEQLEIHSKSYILRWVQVEEGQTISWSLQPHKKSLNFGIVKHPGSGGTNLTTSHGEELTSLANSSETNAETKASHWSKKDKDGSTAQDQLSAKGFVPVTWHGKCDADKASMGTYDVTAGKSGMYGLVFDNTFSKQTSKTATFVLLTYPTGALPQPVHNLPNQANNAAASASRTSLGRYNSPRIGSVGAESVDSLHNHQLPGGKGVALAPQRSEGGGVPGACHVGLLLKRRRKRGQGFARRFFSLDYTSCTLSYYYNRNSSKLRGAIPLSLAAIAADERRREINIDSGAEIWHLKASNAKEFTEWAHALERASRIARGLESGLEIPSDSLRVNTVAAKHVHVPPHTSEDEDREWEQVETLVSRIVGTRDALRRLVKDMATQQKHHRPTSSHLSPASAPVSEEGDSYFTQPQDKRSFWKRKVSAPTSSPMTPPSNFQSQLSVPSPASVVTTISANGGAQEHGRKKSRSGIRQEFSMHDHCISLLGDLDSVASEFSGLISTSKRRRLPAPPTATSRRSIDSSSSEEFFDAEGGDTSQLMMIERRSEDEEDRSSEADEGSIHDDSSITSDEEEEDVSKVHGTAALYPAKPKSLAPLPIDKKLKRRNVIPAATVMPPSLIAFVRKNVGKDLSTISMPVSANEPISLLQRVSEQLEYAQLLDKAATQKMERDRLLYVTAFAISQFSVNRAKERAIRKPFNPLLGETFELLRTEHEVPGGFRLLVEKVCHRPVRLAMHADSANWSFSQSPAPSQKFWGKSMELTTEGRIRVALRLSNGTDELYSWDIATMFLRNVVMGEKYVEPVGNMHVTNDTTCAKAMIEFRAKGMFGGRGEDVQVETYGGDGVHTGMSLTGTWTGGLRLLEAGRGAGEEIWRVGPLVDNAPNVYGMTQFAAALNEITDVERGKLPCTDTRLRPDQRLCEQGDLDEAESWKTKLEEAQRTRRREMEEQGKEHKPKWFVSVDSGGEEEVWRMKTGKDGYWEERAKGGWGGVGDIFVDG